MLTAENRAMALRVFREIGVSTDQVDDHLDEPPPYDTIPDGVNETPFDGPLTAAEVAAPAASRLALITPPAWRDVPLEPMRWVATNRIPASDVTILSGDGGGGKTTVALQLAVSVERGLGDWLGTTCEAGPVIFFSGEEPEAEMRRRLHRVARKRGLEPADLDGLHFHFADPDACLLGIAQRRRHHGAGAAVYGPGGRGARHPARPDRGRQHCRDIRWQPE